VPIQRNGRLHWKRTSKSATFDLCIDPINQDGRADRSTVSRFIFPAKTYDWNRATHTMKNTAQLARADYSRVKSVADIVAIFRERSSMRFRQFSLESYTQTHIAWGLALLAIGDAEEGERHLRLYCEQFSVDRNERKIREAELLAKEFSLR